MYGLVMYSLTGADVPVEFERVEVVAPDAPSAHDVADRRRMLAVDLFGLRHVQCIGHLVAGGQLVDVRLRSSDIRDVTFLVYHVLSSRPGGRRGRVFLVSC